MTASVPEQQSGSIDESDETAAAETLTRDDAFELISNQRRRHTLHYLKQNGEDATLGEIAEQIAAWENGTTVDVAIDTDSRVIEDTETGAFFVFVEDGRFRFDAPPEPDEPVAEPLANQDGQAVKQVSEESAHQPDDESTERSSDETNE